MRTTLWISCAVVAAGLALAGCSRTVVHKDAAPDVVVVEQNEPGPPAHAPAHGHRRKDGERVVLVYNSSLQVYVVENYPQRYYSAGQYFRPAAKGWEWSVDVAGPWRPVKADSDIPPGLRRMDVSIRHEKPGDE
jgi:hypothetical protein